MLYLTKVRFGSKKIDFATREEAHGVLFKPVSGPRRLTPFFTDRYCHARGTLPFLFVGTVRVSIGIVHRFAFSPLTDGLARDVPSNPSVHKSAILPWKTCTRLDSLESSFFLLPHKFLSLVPREIKRRVAVKLLFLRKRKAGVEFPKTFLQLGTEFCKIYDSSHHNQQESSDSSR